MRELLFLFLLLLACCGNPCSCEPLSTDPFNLSTLPSGCGCSVGKIYVPDVGVDIAEEVTPTKSPDAFGAHKIKSNK